MKIKDVSKERIQTLKEQYVLNKFTEYQYHKLMYNQIQQQLERIAKELQEHKTNEQERYSLSPWQSELLDSEQRLLTERGQHMQEMNLVDQWLLMLNENHQNIIISFAIHNGCKNGIRSAYETNNTESNIYKATKRAISKIAKTLI